MENLLFHVKCSIYLLLCLVYIESMLMNTKWTCHSDKTYKYIHTCLFWFLQGDRGAPGYPGEQGIQGEPVCMKWTTTWENVSLICAPNENSYQPALLCSLIKVFVVRILAYPKCAQWGFWSDCVDAQADLILCWVYMSENIFCDVYLLLSLWGNWMEYGYLFCVSQISWNINIYCLRKISLNCD